MACVSLYFRARALCPVSRSCFRRAHGDAFQLPTSLARRTCNALGHAASLALALSGAEKNSLYSVPPSTAPSTGPTV